MERNVVVTGANRGIGYEFARQHLLRGDKVFALARNTGGPLRELAGDRLRIISCDVADTASVKTAAREVCSATDRVDILYNNAGVNPVETARRDVLGEDDFDYFLEVYNINAVGLLRVTGSLLRLLGPGSVMMNLTSGKGSSHEQLTENYHTNCAYAASKAAFNNLSLSILNSLKGTGIHVFVVDPGCVRTETGQALAEGGNEHEMKLYHERSVAPEDTAHLMIEMAIHPERVPHGRVFLSRYGLPMEW